VNEHPNVMIVRSAYEAVERGDVDAFAAVLDDDIVWHESMPGFEGTYHGRDDVLALLGRVFEETGMELHEVSIDHVLADDTHATILLETTVTVRGRRRMSRYVDVYRVRDGKATEHWHLPLDPSAEAELYGAGTSGQRQRTQSAKETPR
jgi:ketosteroid isomerase-like protein